LDERGDKKNKSIAFVSNTDTSTDWGFHFG
jgi:hypothetical protein